MAKQEFLTNEEAVELVKLAQAGSEEAEEQLIIRNEKALRSLVRRYNQSRCEPEDLYQVACLGFLKGIRTFDPEKYPKFLVHGLEVAKGVIRQYIRDTSWRIHVPRQIKDMITTIQTRKLEEATVDQIFAQVKEERRYVVAEALDFIRYGYDNITSTEATLYDDGSGEIITVGSQLNKDVNGEYWLENLLVKESISEALSQLTEKEQLVLKYRFGSELPQHDVGVIIGVSQYHVSRLERAALAKLRNYINDGVLNGSGMKKKEVELDKDGNRVGVIGNPKGDREEAIRMLKETEISTKEISRLTGVPYGTMAKLGPKHRSKEVTERIKAKTVGRKKKELVSAQ